MGFGDFLSGGAGENIGWGDIWGPNAGHMLRLFDQVATLPGRKYGELNRVAPIDPWMQDAVNQQYNYSQGLAPALQDRYMRQGDLGFGGLQGLGNTADQIASGQFGQGIFDQTMANLMPGMQGAYDAATRDMTRQTNEQIIPGIQSDAFMTGNTASSSAATNTALAQRGLADRQADVASDLWQNAANQALQAQQRGAGQALQGYGQLANQGLGGWGNAATMGKDAFNQLMQAGQAKRGWQQEQIDEAVNRYEYNRDAPWVDLSQKLQMMSAGQTPQVALQHNAQRGGSMFGGLLDLGMAGAGLASGMGWNPFGGGVGLMGQPGMQFSNQQWQNMSPGYSQWGF